MSKFCQFCGKQIEDEAKFCPYCGKNVEVAQSGSFAYEDAPNNQTENGNREVYDEIFGDKEESDRYYEDLNRRYGYNGSKSGYYSESDRYAKDDYYRTGLGERPKNKWISLALLVCTGCGHKFYEEKIGMGLLYLFTGGLFGIGWLIDLISIATGPETYYV